MSIQKIKKLLVANRGEIAIRIFRAAAELNIKTIGIFTYEDRYSLHRYKSDESYQIGKIEEALKPYLNVEVIIELAKKENVDAIHPGYGFLSENIDFVRRCEEENILFVGPSSKAMEQLGDKVSAKKIAQQAKVPIIQDSQKSLKSIEIATEEAQKIGYPIVIKAAAGGGGRGMRVVKSAKSLASLFQEAKNEARVAFGDDTIFIEKYIESPKHIEVQVMADRQGNLVHLFERDCSVQRRFQKVVEIAPCQTISEETRQKLCNYALSICRNVRYRNVGTVEFLTDSKENIYFIEVNPRVQVEHTITEEVTGIDIVRSQLLIAQGYSLHGKELNIPQQKDIKCYGHAIQCRLTTEDPKNDFRPHFGTMIAYRNAGGFGIRIDEGSAYPGMSISPFFDSMIVKVSSRGNTLKDASFRLQRALREFRIRGVKTNIGFLQNVLRNETFLAGKCTVTFIADTPELMNIIPFKDSATKALAYIGEVSINGNPDVKIIDKEKVFRTPKVPNYPSGAHPLGTKNKLEELGREGFVKWLKNEQKIHFTDTTFRDAHQSLLATRFRTIDLLRVAESFAKNHPDTFSMEVWGGATFDVALRFLHEDPWQRLQKLHKAIPNILLQMLLRGSNGVGYKAYPQNVIKEFTIRAARNGISLFRIFDAFNNIDSMKNSIETVINETSSLAEVAVCYTGDVLNKTNNKYNLQYYLDLARRIEDTGAHLLAIKDMAGLLKPLAATELIGALKQATDLPIHLHTHDTSSIQSATYLSAIEAGVHVIDVAISSLSGLTSQPSFNALVEMVKYHKRENPINVKKLNEFSNYWEDVRMFYYPFETELKSGTADVYNHEIPGGQYSNLRPQARSMGLEDQFENIKFNYAQANELLGDIVKVTPSSKVVGDLAMFMTSQGLTKQDLVQMADTLSFPTSFIDMLKGNLGKPMGGFPKELKEKVLKNEQEIEIASLEDIDIEAEKKKLEAKYGSTLSDIDLDFLSYQLYPKVFEEYMQFRSQYGEVSNIPTLPFLYGLSIGGEVTFEIKKGKTINIKLLFFSEPEESGYRTVSFTLNGKNRQIRVKDQKYESQQIRNVKADPSNDLELGAPTQGKLSDILVKRSSIVQEGTPLFIIEAMKMETTITSHLHGKIGNIVLSKGSLIEQNDLVLVLEKI